MSDQEYREMMEEFWERAERLRRFFEKANDVLDKWRNEDGQD